eukprot:1161446-Pelagomonas_calceolata.AAC.9
MAQAQKWLWIDQTWHRNCNAKQREDKPFASIVTAGPLREVCIGAMSILWHFNRGVDMGAPVHCDKLLKVTVEVAIQNLWSPVCYNIARHDVYFASSVHAQSSYSTQALSLRGQFCKEAEMLRLDWALSWGTK